MTELEATRSPTPWSPSDLAFEIGVTTERVRQLYRDGRIPSGVRVDDTDLIRFPEYPRIVRGTRGPHGQVGAYIDWWEENYSDPVRDVESA